MDWLQLGSTSTLPPLRRTSVQILIFWPMLDLNASDWRNLNTEFMFIMAASGVQYKDYPRREFTKEKKSPRFTTEDHCLH